MIRTDLADPYTGILASFAGHQPLAVFERGASGEGAAFELEASDLGPQVELGNGGPLGTWTVTAQRLTGRLRANDGSTTQIDAIGASSGGFLADPAATSSSDQGEATDPAILRRSVVICFEDASLLVLFAAKTEVGLEHDAEQVAAALIDASGATTRFSRPLLSTEYDAAGTQRRATLELWPDGPGTAGPLRGGGVAVAATEIELPGAHSTLAFFEWTVGGRQAIGRYEIIRAR